MNVSRKMLAAVYRGPGDIRVEERPVPSPGPGEAVVRVAKAGICGTDLRILRGLHKRYPPGTVRVPGHELVGTVEYMGAGAGGIALGETVAVAPNIGCGRCRQCALGRENLCSDLTAIGVTQDGAFAQYLCVPASAVSAGNLIGLADGIDLSVAALIEPLACVLRGQEAVSVASEDVVVVLGAGPIGMMHLLLAKSVGARVVVAELIPERRASAKDLGADVVVDSQSEDLAKVVEEESGGHGADVVVVAAAVGALQSQAIELASFGGRINFFGGLPADRVQVGLDTNRIHYRELRVTGTTGCTTKDVRQAAWMVGEGRIDLFPLVGETYPLVDIGEALETAEGRKVMKVLVDPFSHATSGPEGPSPAIDR